jgi:glycosyltransferase involved in cell wall biosynthesis
MLVSIAIPCYEMFGEGSMFLDFSLKKIKEQTHKNIEVIISDHSLGDEIKNICDNYKNEINIIYIKNEKNRGSSSTNLNCALKNCSGKIIKILMQDEYLLETTSIEEIERVFSDNDSIKWLLNSCVYGSFPNLEKGRLTPKYSDDLIKSINTIGSPSALTIKNENLIFFNEELIWVMDCDYYKRMYDFFGFPYILDKHLVYVVQHKNQLSNIINKEKKEKEEYYLNKKYTK